MTKSLIMMSCACLLLTCGLYAQTKTPEDGKVGRTVNKVGNKTAKVAVKTTSRIVDKKYEGKTGPDGETVYINKKSQYYFVNGRGKRVYIPKAALKDKSPD